MKLQDEIGEQLKSIPEGYYDFLVYFSTGIFFSSGLLYLTTPLKALFEMTKDISVFNSILIAIVLFVFVTLQGQIASSFSIFVKLFINRLLKIFRVKHSNFNYTNKTSNSTTPTVDGYWDDLFWIYLNHPLIAKIMIKRYARVKLSRANSFNCILLLINYFVLQIFHRIPTSVDQTLFLIITVSMTVVLILEYWLRQSWFNDGIKKFMLTTKDKVIND